MTHLTQGSLTLALALPLLAFTLAGPSLSGEAKCRALPERAELPDYVWLIDMERAGDDLGNPGIPHTEVAARDMACAPRSDRIFGVKARRGVVSVLTSDGLTDFLKGYLSDFAEEQEGYHARHGRYASSASELSFFDSRLEMPISVQADETGWSARVRHRHTRAVTCEIAVGTAELPREGPERGTPVCRPAG